MGTIRIYPQEETAFDNNGICIIEPSECIINRNLNEYKYSLELYYPITNDDNKWTELEENRILRYYDDRFDEYFRINLVRKTNTEVYIFADQLFINDSKYNFIEDTNIVNKTCNLAIAQLTNGTQFNHRFTGTSNIGVVNSARIVRKNLSDALFGDDENSIINRWGGEFDCNKFSFKLDQQIGIDRGYEIKYGKNLSSIEVEIDMTNVVTRIMPYGFDGIMLEEKYVDSKNIDNYAMPIIQKFDYDDVKWKGSPNYSEPSDDEEDDGAYDTLEEARKELKRRAELEFTQNKVDLPEITFNIDFVELSKTEEYKKYKQLLLLNIGDTITVRHKKLGVDIKVRVMSYEYNCLTEKFDLLTLGSYKQSYLSSTSKNNQVIEKLPETINTFLQDAKNKATDLINSAMGGYVVKTNSELLIMDTDNINTAQRVWRWNINGLGYSSTGYKGQYGLAMTMDGSIVADFINTGTLKAELIKSGLLESFNGKTWIDMKNGTFSLANGAVKYDGSNFKITGYSTNQDVKSIIEQSPDSIKIGFNDINDVIEMTSTGMKVKTPKGSYTKFQANGMNSYNNDGDQMLGIENGGISFYAHSNDKLCGYITESALWNGSASANGVVISTAKNGTYISLGTSNLNDVNNTFDLDEAITISANAYFQPEGINLWKDTHAHGTTIRQLGGLNIADSGKIQFDYLHTSPSVIYEDMSNGHSLYLMGGYQLHLGCMDGTGEPKALIWMENQSNIHSYASWNFHGYTVSNMNGVTSAANLSTRSLATAYSTTSNTDGTRYLFKDAILTNGQVIRSLPSEYNGCEYDIVSIVCKGEGNAWVESEEETRFTIKGTCTSVNVEIIIYSSDNSDIIYY